MHVRQEFVIVGWTPSGASGRAVRNLLLARHGPKGTLAYAGRVGTGFNADNIGPLMDAMKPLERPAPAAEVPAAEARGARWLKPALVAEIAYAERTGHDRVRHAAYLGLRKDKPARAVEPGTPDSDVRISNSDRLIFPEAKITKGQLADYYARMGGAMLPWAAGRPISLVRCPQGRARQCFFQRHDSGGFGDHVKHVPIREKDGGTEDYLYVDDVDGLLACVQMGTIEFHGWGARVEDIERPDRMIFDLDPDAGIGFDAVKKAARDLRATLADIGLASFPMLTGGKGVHVIVPLTPEAEWPAVKDFASRFAQALAAQEPDRFTATMSKAKRKGRIFIDWLRNQRGATAILPYAARARPHAPVAAPVTWDELAATDAAGRFTVKDARDLLKRAGSRELGGWGEANQGLP